MSLSKLLDVIAEGVLTLKRERRVTFSNLENSEKDLQFFNVKVNNCGRYECKYCGKSLLLLSGFVRERCKSLGNSSVFSKMD